MKKVIIKEQTDTIDIEEVKDETPVFVKKDGKFVGMVVNLLDEWSGNTGYCPILDKWVGTKFECMKDLIASGYELYIED